MQNSVINAYRNIWLSLWLSRTQIHLIYCHTVKEKKQIFKYVKLECFIMWMSNDSFIQHRQLIVYPCMHFLLETLPLRIFLELYASL